MKHIEAFIARINNVGCNGPYSLQVEPAEESFEAFISDCDGEEVTFEDDWDKVVLARGDSRDDAIINLNELIAIREL